LIALGIIRKPHGIRGEASVEPWTDSAERFTEVSRITLVSPDESSQRETTIESVRFHAGRVLVKFSGIESVDELRNWTIEIPDVIGMKLVDANGREQGIVTDAYEGGGGTLLEVTRGRRKFEVPFATDICTAIDVAAKTIVVMLPEGIDAL
jgi:16S rRNA processing protein RimM